MPHSNGRVYSGRVRQGEAAKKKTETLSSGARGGLSPRDHARCVISSHGNRHKREAHPFHGRDHFQGVREAVANVRISATSKKPLLGGAGGARHFRLVVVGSCHCTFLWKRGKDN